MDEREDVIVQEHDGPRLPMTGRRLRFSNHALERTFEEGISFSELREAFDAGQVVEEYPDDAPYPSRLVVGWSQRRCIHVVAADVDEEETIIITAYEPDPERWEAPDFTQRRPRG